MISSWMLHSMAVAALLGVSAYALERALLAAGRPTRWLWAGSLAASLVYPALWLLVPEAAPAGAAAVGVGAAEVLSVAPGAETGASRLLLERALALCWLLSSAAILAKIVLSVLRARWERRAWTPGVVQGESVLVSADRGPAVTGFLRPEIVVPGWVLSCSEDEQRLLLAHEREHLRAGDTRLLVVALVALALAPWNLVLWWQLRRLRLAVEVDCDARVLREIPRPREYGLLLLEVGRRASGLPLPAVAFGEPRSFLERRVRRLAGSPRQRPGARVALTLTGLATLAAACEVPEPRRPDLDGLLPTSPPTAQSAAAGVDTLPWRPTFTPYTEKPELTNRVEFGRALEAGYPSLLRDAGIGGMVVLWVRIGETGEVSEVRVSAGSGHPELDDTAERVMYLARFTPARNEGAAVPVWIQLPVKFETR